MERWAVSHGLYGAGALARGHFEGDVLHQGRRGVRRQLECPGRLVDGVAAPDGPGGKKTVALLGGEGVELYAGFLGAWDLPGDVAPVDGVLPFCVGERMGRLGDGRLGSGGGEAAVPGVFGGYRVEQSAHERGGRGGGGCAVPQSVADRCLVGREGPFRLAAFGIVVEDRAQGEGLVVGDGRGVLPGPFPVKFSVSGGEGSCRSPVELRAQHRYMTSPPNLSRNALDRGPRSDARPREAVHRRGHPNWPNRDRELNFTVHSGLLVGRGWLIGSVLGGWAASMRRLRQ